MPWEYEDSDLISLCNLCHYNLHSTQSIPIYNNHGQRIDNAEILINAMGLDIWSNIITSRMGFVLNALEGKWI